MSRTSLNISLLTLILYLIFSSINARSQSLIWDLADTISIGTIREVSCINKDICIYRYELMFNNGIILKLTTDGGLNWTHIFADTNIIDNETFLPIYLAPNYYTLSFKSQDKIILTADTNIFWYSNDLGKTWIKDSIDEGYSLSIKMVNSLNGLMYKTPKGSMLVEIFATSNGGISWHEIHKPLEHKWDLNFFGGVLMEGSIYLYSINEDWGYSLNWTSDLGKTWDSYYYGGYYAFNDLQFINPYIGFSINRYMNLDSNKTFFSVMKTYDSGATWTVLLESDSVQYSRLSFSDSLNGIVAGSTTDLIIRTTDGGYSWHKDTVHGIPPRQMRNLRNINMIESKSAFLSTSRHIIKLTDRPTSIANFPLINQNSIDFESIIVNKEVDLEILNDCAEKSQIFITIYNSTGKLISNDKFRYSHFDKGVILNFSNFTSGFYLIRVDCASKNKLLKLLII
ncbi:MAG: hypothetical protein M9949_02600 [Candidatus Kapabacteria bacterium]|nr:hypothetical protein [Candidatus Kapabacteria bacterium]